jgi:hypothetical protein
MVPPFQILGRQRSKFDVLHPTRCSNGVQLAHERIRCSDFVVAISADEEKIAGIRPAQRVFQQIDAHGRRLWADANLPRGGVFQFTLPGAEVRS